LGKKSLALIGGALALVTLAGCGSVDSASTSDTSSTDESAPANETSGTDSELTWTAPDDLEGTLTLYSANPQGLTDDLIAEFTQETGVKVETFAGETGKITAKLDAEWENPQADMVYLASWAPAAKYAADGRLMSYQP